MVVGGGGGGRGGGGGGGWSGAEGGGRAAEAVVEGPRGSPRRHNTQCHNVRSSNSVCPNHSTTAPHVDGRHRGTRAYKHIRYSPSLLDTSL